MHSAAQACKHLLALRLTTGWLVEGFAKAEQHVLSHGGKKTVNDLRVKLNEILRDQAEQDRTGNFEMQVLMSRCNQAVQLSSSVQKKKHDTGSAMIQKIG